MIRNSSITLRLPADTRLPVPVGHWHRDSDGSIVASYERGNSDGEAQEIEALWR